MKTLSRLSPHLLVIAITALLCRSILCGDVEMPCRQGAVTKQAMAAVTATQNLGSDASRPVMSTYTVRPGDTLWSISKKYGITVDTMVKLNGLKNPDVLSVGQKLKVMTADGVVHAVSRGDSLWRISNRYGVALEDIVRANRLENPDELQVGQQLIIPGIKEVRASAAATASAGSSTLRVSLVWPLKGKLSSYYGPRWGRFHSGIDIAAPRGTAIRAAAAGTVVSTGWVGDYGYTVVIDHGMGVKTRYAHLSKISVRRGQRVTTGTIIGSVGSTGRSTGPHLHFEVIVNGNTKDPLRILP